VKTTIDVFSLGAILFFLHVKRPLYESVKKLKSSLDNLNKVLDQEDIENQVVRSLIVGCCKFKEDERISSVDKIFELIERIERESDLGGYNNAEILVQVLLVIGDMSLIVWAVEY
ncbi:12623_t:CDS:2, partial [Entrophospora sp. SA101]